MNSISRAPSLMFERLAAGSRRTAGADQKSVAKEPIAGEAPVPLSICRRSHPERCFLFRSAAKRRDVFPRRLLLPLAILFAGGASPGQETLEPSGSACGVMAGDVVSDAAVIWGRADGPARMQVDWRRRGEERWVEVVGPVALETSDFTAKTVLRDLPASTEIEYRVRFASLEDPGGATESGRGKFSHSTGF